MQAIRLGVLLPTGNRVLEPDMYKMAPKGVTVHFERLGIIYRAAPPPGSVEGGLRQRSSHGEDIERATKVIASVEPKVIAYGCTSGSYFKGIDYNKELIRKMEAAAGIPAITTSMASVEALRELGLKKVCFITPYDDFFTEKGKEFFEASGFEVPVTKHLTITSFERKQLPPEAVLKLTHELAISAYNPSCDGIFCSCTGFNAIEIIEEVEKEIGKPMISANQATMWLMLKIAEVRKAIKGFGELMTHL